MKYIVELPDGRTPKMCTPESGNGCEQCGMECGLDNAKEAVECGWVDEKGH